MPRFDRENRVIGLIHVIRDISERKKVEEALQRAEQLKTVGEWATGLVHEIKNPLAGIKGSVEVLADEAGDEVVTVIIASLAAQGERQVTFRAGSLQVLRIELFGEELVGRALVNEHR